MRGYFLVFMLLNHLAFTGGLWLVHVNHAELGFVQDAQGFIFLSGLLVGLIYTRQFLRGDDAAATGKVLRRALVLYAHAMGVTPTRWASSCSCSSPTRSWTTRGSSGAPGQGSPSTRAGGISP